MRREAALGHYQPLSIRLRERLLTAKSGRSQIEEKPGQSRVNHIAIGTERKSYPIRR